MRRRLFLDDDPARAAVFFARYPDAVWVQTAPDCVDKLAERWDEVHLDHDLGGEHYVESDREDCGMAVVRWLTVAPRPYLARSRFTVHSHNMMAAYEMLLRLQAAGYRTEAHPFGLDVPQAPPVWLDYWRRFRFGMALKIRQLATRLAQARRRTAAQVPPADGVPPEDRADSG